MPEQEVYRGTVMVEKKEGIEEAWYADKERIPEDNLQPGMEHYYMLFNNSNEAFAMHQQMKKNQLESRISPTPRQLSICCGVTLLVKYESAINSPDLNFFTSRQSLRRWENYV